MLRRTTDPDLTRRRLLELGLAAPTLSLLIAACGGDDEPSAGADAQTAAPRTLAATPAWRRTGAGRRARFDFVLDV